MNFGWWDKKLLKLLFQYLLDERAENIFEVSFFTFLSIKADKQILFTFKFLGKHCKQPTLNLTVFGENVQ